MNSSQGTSRLAWTGAFSVVLFGAMAGNAPELARGDPPQNTTPGLLQSEDERWLLVDRTMEALRRLGEAYCTVDEDDEAEQEGSERRSWTGHTESGSLIFFYECDWEFPEAASEFSDPFRRSELESAWRTMVNIMESSPSLHMTVVGTADTKTLSDDGNECVEQILEAELKGIPECNACESSRNNAILAYCRASPPSSITSNIEPSTAERILSMGVAHIRNASNARRRFIPQCLTRSAAAEAADSERVTSREPLGDRRVRFVMIGDPEPDAIDTSRVACPNESAPPLDRLRCLQQSRSAQLVTFLPASPAPEPFPTRVVSEVGDAYAATPLVDIRSRFRSHLRSCEFLGARAECTPTDSDAAELFRCGPMSRFCDLPLAEPLALESGRGTRRRNLSEASWREAYRRFRLQELSVYLGYSFVTLRHKAGRVATCSDRAQE